MQVEIFDETKCELGEGPLWHPLRNELIWFDIQSKRLLKRSGNSLMISAFDRNVSAAGWVDHDHLLIADEFGLFKFNLQTEAETRIVDIEKDNPVTRSNDGRADPFGGFWIGTMGKEAEDQAGAIYRYYRGEVRQLFDNISISNSICFSPDKRFAFYTDTPTKKVMRVALDQQNGWPVGESEVFVDLNADGLNPDGSVIDADGNLWNAQWGANRVAKYDRDGSFVSSTDLPASQITCPAFGGEQGTTLFLTSAATGLEPAEEDGGKTFTVQVDAAGQKEHQVIL